MTRDEHKNVVNQLLSMVTAEHQASASDLLTQLSDDYEETLTNMEKASTDVTKLKENNETLREVNAKLFLRVGQTDTNINNNESNPNDNNDVDELELSFEDLFNEKGELK